MENKAHQLIVIQVQAAITLSSWLHGWGLVVQVFWVTGELGSW